MQPRILVMWVIYARINTCLARCDVNYFELIFVWLVFLCDYITSENNKKLCDITAFFPDNVLLSIKKSLQYHYDHITWIGAVNKLECIIIVVIQLCTVRFQISISVIRTPWQTNSQRGDKLQKIIVIARSLHVIQVSKLTNYP